MARIDKRKTVTVYSCVTILNHLHVAWEMKEPNGKQMQNNPLHEQ